MRHVVARREKGISMRKYVTILNREVHLALVVMFCIIVLLSSVVATIYYTKTVDHQAHIITNGKIQTYSNPSCTQVLNSHDWGDFNTSSGDDVKTLDFYLKNEGNTEINVTWKATGFTYYNTTEEQYETSSWKLYLVEVDVGETKLRSENDTTPDKVNLSPASVAHFKLYLTAIADSEPEDFTFQTSFSSQDN